MEEDEDQKIIEERALKLQEVRQEEIMLSDEEADNIFEREMQLIDQELKYLNLKKNEEMEEHSP